MRFIIVLLAVTATLLVLNTGNRLSEFRENRAQSTQYTVHAVAEQIAQQITNLRHQVRLLGEREGDLLMRISTQPDHASAFKVLTNHVYLEFSDALAVTLADAKGEPIATNLDGYKIDTCRHDILRYAIAHAPPDIDLHATPSANHIDIMAAIQLEGLGQYILSISFKPEIISRILARSTSYGGDPLILKSNQPTLAKISAENVGLPPSRTPLSFTHEPQNYIMAETNVVGTEWNLASLAEKNGPNQYRTHLGIELAIQLALIGVIGLFMLHKLRRSQQTISAAQLETLAAQHASQSKSSFLANMSHEIRTPLTAIIGFAETLLQNDQDQEERTSATKTVINSSKHLLHLINDILDVSKIESGKLEIETLRFSPFELLREVQELIEPQAHKKRLNFHINYHYPLPITIKNDTLRLKQILINLCSNALKFTRKGHVIINVGADITQQKMTFSVEDTGKGMDATACQRIFEAYTQADSSTSRIYGGTGLGLALSKQLAQKLGGDIQVTSNPGLGSIFRLTIATGEIDQSQLIYNQDQLPKAQTLPLDTPLPALSGKVLVAEDNQANQRLFKLIMKKMGADVQIADNGRRAVELALNESFDLVFMDMLMPVMNGIEAISELRARGYKGPVIALTANATKEQKDQCISAGCDGFATKPISRDDLYAVMTRYLKLSTKNSIETPLTSTLLAEDPELIDLLHKFAKELPKMQTKLWRHLDDNDWPGFRELMHQFKGVIGNYGYLSVAELAAKIELRSINKNNQEVRSLMHKLNTDITRIQAGIPEESSCKKVVNFPRG